jgi:predicted MFS family arabinose efflux permease
MNRPVGNAMNRKAIIILMTVGIFIVLSMLMLLFFEGWPPWPVIFWFAVSHAFFCAVVIRVKPFTGPYKEPMAEPELPHLE